MFQTLYVSSTHATIWWIETEQEQVVTLEELRDIQAHNNEWVPDNEGECEHGLSAWLCEGPNHYPEYM